jgi:hypothetical protein
VKILFGDMKIFFKDKRFYLETLRYLKYGDLVGDLEILFKNLEILLKTWRQAKSSCLEHLLTRKAPFLLLFNNNH